MLSDSFISDMIQVLPHASFKDACTGKYILVNEETSTCCRLDSPAQMVGLTVEDLGLGLTVGDIGLVKNKLSKLHAIQTKEMDQWVQEKRTGTTTTRIVLRFEDDNLTYESVAKLPILGKTNLLGIVTYGNNLTSRLSLRSLYFLYRKMFDRKEAIDRFMRHVRIDAHFFVPPTRSELLVLIERSTGKSNPEIATLHKVGVRTVEAHVSNIKTKLKGDLFQSVIAQLRDRNDVVVD